MNVGAVTIKVVIDGKTVNLTTSPIDPSDIPAGIHSAAAYAISFMCSMRATELLKGPGLEPK